MAETRISLSDCNIVAMCDPAGKKKGLSIKRVTARSAVVVVASDHLERVFAIYSWAARCTTSHLIDKIIWVAEQYKPSIFGIEANAMQSLFADSIQRIVELQQKKLPIHPVYQSTKVDKEFRIRATLQPVNTEDRMFVLAGEGGESLNDEIETFPMAQTVDLVDCFAGAVSILPKRVPKAMKEYELQQLATYLKASGASSHTIEMRINQLKDGLFHRRPEPSQRRFM